MNILFIADVNRFSHDLKWILFFSNQPTKYSCYQIAQKNQIETLPKSELIWFKENNITLLPSIEYYSLKHILRTKRYIKYIREVINKYSINIIHIHYAEPNALWALKRNEFNRPMVLTTRGTDILKSLPALFEGRSIINIILKRLYKKALQNFDMITCTSLEQKQKVNEILGKKGNVTIIRTGVDAKSILSVKDKQLPLELVNKKYVLFPRSMQPLYNHEFTIKAIAKLDVNIRKRYTMVFVNADSSNQAYVKKIKKLLSEVKPLHYIFLKNQLPETLFRIYFNSELVVMNPLSDGTPVTALEAMVCKIPVIVGPLNYDSEIFDGNVYRLSTWNENELSGLIKAVLEKEESSISLENSQHKVLTLADRNLELTKLEMIFSNLVSK